MTFSKLLTLQGPALIWKTIFYCCYSCSFSVIILRFGKTYYSHGEASWGEPGSHSSLSECWSLTLVCIMVRQGHSGVRGSRWELPLSWARIYGVWISHLYQGMNTLAFLQLVQLWDKRQKMKDGAWKPSNRKNGVWLFVTWLLRVVLECWERSRMAFCTQSMHFSCDVPRSAIARLYVWYKPHIVSQSDCTRWDSLQSCVCLSIVGLSILQLKVTWLVSSAVTTNKAATKIQGKALCECGFFTSLG